MGRDSGQRAQARIRRSPRARHASTRKAPEGRVLAQPCIEPAHGVAGFIDTPGVGVGSGGQQVPVLGIEHEDQPHQHRQKALVEVAGLCRGEMADEVGLGSVEASQELMQGAEHLSGERGGDRGLGVAALSQQGRQSAVVAFDEEADSAQQQLEAAQHRPAGDRRQRSDREGQMTGRLAPRRVGQPQSVVGDHQADEHAGFTQEALEPLLRRRLPPVQARPLIRIDAGVLDANEQLPLAGAIAQLAH